MIIKVLGTGCKKCQKTEENAREAVKALGIDATIEKVEDVQGIMSYGVMATPALVIDEQVKVKGKVPTVEEIKAML
ncbi:thioredoxin family protein [Gudongella sp. SC589]|jgi:small redox-active disulfide protein 2|uniref:thioredoxin family protein n=1 Tax=Gudongella sp. SC589 TaxID=3385990 RepID=UPI003904D5C4